MPHTAPYELMIRQRLTALSRWLAGARVGEAQAVHQARVATRRLREALPLATSGSQGRKLERKVRGLTRALGPVRELDVALEMLDQFERKGDVPPAAIACLRELILQERRSLHGAAVKRIDRCDVIKMQRKAVEAIQREHATTGRLVRHAGQAASARRRAGRRAERLRAAIENAAGIYLPDRLHEVRVAVKKLRYTIEIARELRGARGRQGNARSLRSAAGQIAMLKRTQDLLGRMHDLEVLITRTRGVQGSPSAFDLRLSGDLDQLVRQLETECRQLHGHYMTWRSQLLVICERVIASAERASRRTSAA